VSIVIDPQYFKVIKQFEYEIRTDARATSKLSSECGTHKTVETKFWLWLLGIKTFDVSR